MFDQWNGRPICRGMALGSTLSQRLLGYSSNKSMEWFYYCIDWRNCAASTVFVCVCVSHFSVSLGDVLFCPVVLIAVWLLVNQDRPLEDYKGCIDEYKTLFFLLLIIVGADLFYFFFFRRHVDSSSRQCDSPGNSKHISDIYKCLQIHICLGCSRPRRYLNSKPTVFVSCTSKPCVSKIKMCM